MAVVGPDPTDQQNLVGWTCQNLINGTTFSWGQYQADATKPTITSGTTTGTAGSTVTYD